MEKIVAGVMGLGFGARHLQGVIENGVEIGLICDPVEELLTKVGEEKNIPVEKRTTNWLDIVNSKEINTVVVATPDMLHSEHVVALLDAGKNVLCEKPVALETDDINAIVEAVKRNPNSKFMVGQICRFTPAFVKAKEMIDQGLLGELYFVEGEYAHDYKHIFERPGKNWRADPKRHGVIGGGCHAVDLLRWLTGSDPYEVYAYGTHKLLTDKFEYDDSNIAIMKFPGDIMGKIFVSTACKRGYTMRTCVYGTKGTLVFDNKSDDIQYWATNEENDTQEVELIPVDVANHNAKVEFATFMDSLLNDKPVETDVYEGAKTVAACIAIVESANTGKIVNPNYDFV